APSESRSAITTFAPDCASRRTVAAPSPELPPLTRNVLSLICMPCPRSFVAHLYHPAHPDTKSILRPRVLGTHASCILRARVGHLKARWKLEACVPRDDLRVPIARPSTLPIGAV